jgi:capsular exopolysaccharide synthesis family protein
MKSTKTKALRIPHFPVEEAYKTLRTNIQFSSLEDKIQTIVVTSSVPGEGKTTTAINLALAIAQSGHRTILVDCDLRKSKIHELFQISNEKGLSNVLIEDATFEEAIYKDNIDVREVESLYILTAGVKTPNPSELLGSSKMQNLITLLKEEYEYIIIDTPPILLVTDAQVLSQYADGCLLVTASGKTQKDSVVRAKSQLLNVNAKILGVVLNKVNFRNKKDYYNSNYYGDRKKQKE